VNSEELEQSLRAEFETYLRGVITEMRDDLTDFQVKIDAEFEKHKSHIDETFKVFSSRFDTEHDFDGAFRESVIEHLRLARDEGAKITATAMAEAEDLERASAPQFSLSDIKDAVNDISSKDSQSSILKSLIHHAAEYTPRGAFFIIKNDHFVGWRVFGKEAGDGESAVRDIHFPVSADSLLGSAVRSHSISESSFGTFAEDSAFLDPLQFGQPDRMYAIPLVARGRGVAVLYADYGHEGITVNTDALEMLVRVAGLTVEMLASAKAVRNLPESPNISEHAKADHVETPHASFSDSSEDKGIREGEYDHLRAETEYRSGESVVESSPMSAFDTEKSLETETEVEPSQETSFEERGEINDGGLVEFSAEESLETVGAVEAGVAEVEPSVSESSFTSNFDIAQEYTPALTTDPDFESENSAQTFESAEFEQTHPIVDFSAVSAITVDEVDTPVDLVSVDHDISDDADENAIDWSADSSSAVSDDSGPAFDGGTDTGAVSSFETAPFDRTVEQFEPAGMNGAAIPVIAPLVIESLPSPVTGSRLSDRNVDLPIEVAEDERRLHNDARRFARLLVSEIKLYNEKKVTEGREASDLYERLREAIDRSREMYDKRVQPPVASKFDYFHYELVNSLAEGDVSRLGSSYHGAKV
jgi:hypothetical protein